MGTDARAEVGELYAAGYPRLVAFVGAVVQDRDLAEEAVQDAFVRLLGQWSTVSRYDDPYAWLRTVALGFASNRRRKARNGVTAWRRHGPAPALAPPDGGAVDLDRALATLPSSQRAVLLLQHLGPSRRSPTSSTCPSAP